MNLRSFAASILFTALLVTLSGILALHLIQVRDTEALRWPTRWECALSLLCAAIASSSFALVVYREWGDWSNPSEKGLYARHQINCVGILIAAVIMLCAGNH